MMRIDPLPANAEYVTTINNLESVVDIYVDSIRQEIIEHKGLNGNRYKSYRYPIDAYLERQHGDKGVDIKINSVLGRLN